jgi:hypothetical protein
MGMRLTDEVQPDSEMPRSGGGAFTLPMLCLGIAIIGCCVLIPQADENRRRVYQREMLRADLEHIEMQIAVNEAFLEKLADDPALAERLAQRQMKMVREGTGVLDYSGQGDGAGGGFGEMSPFRIVSLPPPPPMPEYQPVPGPAMDLFRHPQTQLYLMGAGMLLIAGGLVLGASEGRR